MRRHTDRHISPDGAHLRIARGAYRLEPAEGGRTLLRLETRYALRSPVNFYAALWGDLLLGGIQENVLGIVRDRAEASSTRAAVGGYDASPRDSIARSNTASNITRVRRLVF